LISDLSLFDSLMKTIQPIFDSSRAEAESWQKEREVLIGKTLELQLKVEALQNKSGEIHRSDKVLVTNDNSHDCIDCKYLRRIIAREGKIKELEISALQKELNKKQRSIQSLEKSPLPVVL
jgi:hypothetical protein